MGTVWLAEDEVLQRRVAVKEVAPPAGISPEDAEHLRLRVMREARAAARLNHPNVTTIFDVVQADGRTWIVMEYVNAPTLTEVVQRDGGIAVAEAARIGLGVLAALEAAHAQGIIHRDVKPSNVMVPDQGPIKLADFGVAAVQGDPKLTMTGFILGSPSFMSPEQARESTSTAASDLWGLGATLYFALEGTPPFDRGSAIPTLTAVAHEDPPPMRNGGLLEPVVMRLLSKDPADRPTAGELHAVLTEVDAEKAPAQPAATAAPAPTIVVPEPVAVAAPAPAPERDARSAEPAPTPAPARRSPWPILIAAAALLLVAGLLLPRLFGGTDPVGGDTAAPEDTAAENDGGAQGDTADAGRGDAPGDAEEPAADEPDADAQDDADAPADTAPDGAEEDTAGDPAGDTASGPEITVPEGWTTYNVGATGTTVAHPPEWSVVQRSANSSDITAPTGDRYLRVEYTDTPQDDAVADWEAQSDSFGARKADYQELRIEPVDFRGHEAALWEYTYSEGGAQLHAYNLAVVAGGRGYALNFQTHEAVWAESQELWEQFQASFDPAE